MKIQTNKMFFWVILVLVNVGVYGQTGSISISNSTDQLIYVTTIPSSIEEYQELNTNPSKLVALAENLFPQMDSIPSGSFLPNIPSYQTETLIMSLVSGSQSSGYPITILLTPPKTADVSYQIKSPAANQEHVFLPLTRISPQRTPIVIDGRFVDWLSKPVTRSYSKDLVPLKIIQQQGTSVKTIGVDESMFWTKGGVQLDTLKFVTTTDDLYIMASSYQQITPGTTLTLRYYHSESMELANQTADIIIELPIVNRGGPVYFWRMGADQPIYAGQYGASMFSVEASVSYSTLAEIPGLEIQELTSGTFELATGISDAGIFEEFYYSTLPVEEIFSSGR